MNSQTQRSTTLKFLAFWLVLVGLVACTTQEPVRIIVTPTHEATATPDTTASPSASATIVMQAPPTTSPVPDDAEPTTPPTEIPPTATETQAGDGRYFGPIVGPDYTPPPTSTPRPTTSPTPEAPTPTPIVETPITTPMTTLPALDSSQMGIQLYHNVNIDMWWQLVVVHTRNMGMGWIKMQANWGALQPNGPDDYENSPAFQLFASHVQRAHNEGFRVLVSVVKAPDWARSTTVEDGPPSDPQALARFMTFFLDRLGEQVSAIEIWNEPNLRREWQGNLEFSGAGYMRLFRPAYDAVRAYSPTMPVITAGLAPTGTNPELGSVDDRVYLQQMYDAGLADPYYTNIAVGMHPYSWGNPPDAVCCDNIPGRSWDDDPHFFFMNTIEDYRDIMVRNGHSDVQLWSTEFGWASWSGVPVEAPEAWMSYNTPEQQAEYTLRAFEIGQSRDYMGPMFLWNLNFANPTLIQQRNEMVGYSLFIPGLPNRPLFDQLVSRPK